MQLDTATPFQSFLFSKEELKDARTVPPLFFALLQTRIADRARDALEFSYREKADLQAAVIEHECLKAQVAALQDLMNELSLPTDVS